MNDGSLKRSVIIRTLAYLKPYWGLLAISAFCSMIVGGMDGAFAYLVEPVLKRIFANNDNDIFLLVPLGIVVLFIIRSISRFTYDSTIKLAGQKAIQDIRNHLYRNTIRQDMAFYNRQATGELMSRMTNDIGMMQEGMANVVCGLFRDLISFVSLLCVVFTATGNWRYSALWCCCQPFIRPSLSAEKSRALQDAAWMCWAVWVPFCRRPFPASR